MMKAFLVFLISLVSLVVSRQVCYDQLGCFTDEYPFSGTLQRPIALLPESPQKIAVKFTLFNAKTSSNGEVINADFLGDNYVATRPTKFITHGFVHNANKEWVIAMKNAILSVENANVITVDWSKGNGFPYTQSTANTQVVGAEIARLINSMVNKKGAKPADFHLIGHSLGSHISGYAGERVAGLGRITGIDPAGPYFENTDPRVRLDPSDAKFVDIIHSDGTANLLLGLGLMQPLGHVDFYPNGGKDQPDCPATSLKLLGAIFNLALMDVSGMEDILACSHMAAVHFFTDTIKDQCRYTAFPCKSEEDFNNGNCIKCSDKGCNRMGYYASPSKDLGTLYLNTRTPTKPDYCLNNFLVTLYSNKLSNQVQARGKVTAYFESSSDKSPLVVLDDSVLTFKADSTEKKLVSLNKQLESAIERVYISYTKTSNLLSSWLYDNQWSFKWVEVSDGERGTVTRYCPTSTVIVSGATGMFTKC